MSETVGYTSVSRVSILSTSPTDAEGLGEFSLDVSEGGRGEGCGVDRLLDQGTLYGEGLFD